MSETAAEKFTTWACRNAAHETCGGIGFRIMPSGVDLPCVCPCHAQAMSETQAGPADPYVRFWMQGETEVAMLNAADFRAAMIERDHALADLARVTAERDRAREIVDATRRCEMSQWFSGGCPCEGHAALDRQARLDAAQQERS